MLVRPAGRLVCMAVIAFMMTRPALGDEPAGKLTVDLEYGATGECPDMEAFKAIVAERLGHEAFQSDARYRVRVQIEPSARSFEGRIEWRNAEGQWVGERTFLSHSGGCRDLAHAVAFALALQIQFAATTGVTPGSPLEEEKKEPEPAPIPPPSVPTQPEPKAGPAFDVGVGTAFGWGLQSSAAPFGRLFGSVVWPRALVELAADAGTSSMARREDGAGVSHRVLFLSLAGCAAGKHWSACWLAKGGAIRAKGTDIDEAVTAWAAGFLTGPRLSFIQPLGRGVYVALHAAGLLNLTTWTVRLDRTTVWSAPRFAEVVGLDLALRFE